MRIIISFLAILAWATNSHAQHSPADSSHQTVHNPSPRLNFGAGVSDLRSNGRSSTKPTVIGIVRIDHRTDIEVEGGFWANARDHCTERSSALVASIHREIRGPWGATAGALIEANNCRDEREREMGLILGPAYTLHVKKLGIILAPGLAWTRNNHGEQALGLHTGVMIRTWR